MSDGSSGNATGYSPGSAPELPSGNPTGQSAVSAKGKQHRLAMAAVTVVVLATAWPLYDWYRSIPLRELPAIDLLSVDPAVKKAIQTARSGVLAAPRSGAAWGELGTILEAHVFHQQAQLCLAQAMRFDAHKFLWPYLRGDILSPRDPPEAERCFRQAARLRPKLALPRVRLGELLLEQRRLDDAAQEFAEALRIEPDDARTMFGLGQVAFCRGDYAQARRWAEQSFALAPEFRRTAELLLKAVHRLGDKAALERQQAVVEGMAGMRDDGWPDPFTKEVTLKRRDIRGQAARAIELLEGGRVTDAISAFERVVEGEPENPLWHSMLGTTLIRHGDFAQAARVLDAGLRAHPQSAELHFDRGLAHFFLGEWAEAAGQYRRAIELKSDFGDAQYNLAQALVKLGDKPGAISAFREALKSRPGDSSAYASLGKLLAETGDRAAALDALETAAKLAPDDAAIQQSFKALRNNESR